MRRFRRILAKIDDPAGALEELRQRAIGRLDALDCRHVQARNGSEAIILRLEPQRAAGTLDQIGKRLDALLLDARHRALGRKGTREPEPFGAVVVAVRKEMLADEDLQFRPESA